MSPTPPASPPARRPWPVPRVARVRALANGLFRHARGRLLHAPCWSAVTLLLTLRCDCRCGYCDFPRHASEELSTDEVLRLLQGLRRAGTAHLGISGGEPLLRPDLERVLAAAYGHGFLVSLVTNGIQLGERLDCLAHVDYLLCTVEGPAAVQDRIKGEGAYRKTLSALEAARRRGGVRLGLICPVHVDNAEVVEHPLHLAEHLGVRVYYQPVQGRTGWRGRALQGALEPALERQVFRRIAAWKREGRAVGNSERYLRMVAEGGGGASARGCAAGRFFVTVLPDGRVGPCCMLPFDATLPVVDPERPLDAAVRLRAPACTGCTIAPYVENSLLFQLDPGAWLDTLRWGRGGAHRRR